MRRNYRAASLRDNQAETWRIFLSRKRGASRYRW